MSRTLKAALAGAAAIGGVWATGAAAQTADWSGPYVGLQAGYLWGDTDHSFSNGAPSDTSSLGGIVLGGHLGWNFQTSGGFVFGIEGDGEWSNADGSFDNVTGITSVGSSDLQWQASARARLGIANGNYLTHVTAGAAFGRFEFGGGPSPLPPCCFATSTETGWTVGGGIARKIGSNMSLGIEYRYTNYGSVTAEALPTYPEVFITHDTTTHAMRARFGLHF